MNCEDRNQNHNFFVTAIPHGLVPVTAIVCSNCGQVRPLVLPPYLGLEEGLPNG